MWSDKLERIIRNEKIKLGDVAETAGLTRQGLYHALTKNTLRFESAICIMTKFNIDYYDLIGMENPFISEEHLRQEIKCSNIKEITSLFDQAKEQYIDQIEQQKEQNRVLKEHNETLSKQVLFLQQLLANEKGLPIPEN